MCHHARLIFVFLVEMRFLHVGQAVLELLTSGDTHASASQSSGITGLSHRTWPIALLFGLIYLRSTCVPIILSRKNGTVELGSLKRAQ